MALTIRLNKKKALRLARHLEKEHPSTKGKILVNGKQTTRRRLK